MEQVGSEGRLSRKTKWVGPDVGYHEAMNPLVEDDKSKFVKAQEMFKVSTGAVEYM